MKKNKAAAALGRKGGKKKSDRKSAAARANGAKGGRPALVHAVTYKPAEVMSSSVVLPLCGRSGNVLLSLNQNIKEITCTKCLELLKRGDFYGS